MCLHKESKIQIADKNIVVYKSMERRNTRNKTFHSVYYNCDEKYNLNILYNEPNFKKKDENGFYSFCTKKDIKIYEEYKNKNIIFIKCIIPKGSKYINGTQHYSKGIGSPIKLKAIRSEKIIFKKILEKI